MIKINFKGVNKWVAYILMIIIVIAILPPLLVCGAVAVVLYAVLIVIQAIYECFEKLFSPRI